MRTPGEDGGVAVWAISRTCSITGSDGYATTSLGILSEAPTVDNAAGNVFPTSAASTSIGTPSGDSSAGSSVADPRLRNSGGLSVDASSAESKTSAKFG